jgi:uncharacterized repeat protein (TIGR02543 family)
MKKIILILLIGIVTFSLGISSFGMQKQYDTLSITSAYDGYVSIDINFDGKMDMIAYKNTEIALLLNDGTGTYTKTQILNRGPLRSGREIFHLVDYNHDGHLDIVYYDELLSEIRYLENNKDTTFKAPVSILSTTIYAFNLEVLSDDGLFTFAFATDRGIFLYKQGAEGFTGVDGGALNDVPWSFQGNISRVWFIDTNGDGLKDVVFSTNANELRVILNGDLANGNASTLLASLPTKIVDIHFEPLNADPFESAYLMIATEHDSTNPFFLHYMTFNEDTKAFNPLVNHLSIANTKIGDFSSVNTIHFDYLNSGDLVKTLFIGVQRSYGKGYYEFLYSPSQTELRPRDHRNNDLSVHFILFGDVTGNGANDVLTITNTSSSVAVYRVFENAVDGVTINFNTQGGTPIEPIQLPLNPYYSYVDFFSPTARIGLSSSFGVTVKNDADGIIKEVATLGSFWNGTGSTYVIDIIYSGENTPIRLTLPEGKIYDLLHTINFGSESHYVVVNFTDKRIERIDVPTNLTSNGDHLLASVTPKIVADFSQGVTGVSGGLTITNRTIHALTHYVKDNIAYIYISNTVNSGSIHGFTYNNSTNASNYLGRVELDGTALSSSEPTGIDLGDMDGDGNIDIIFGQMGGLSRTVAILHGTADPIKFERRVNVYSGQDRIQGLLVADFNQDDLLDILYLDRDSSTKNSVYLLTQEEDGSFTRNSLPNYPLVDFSPNTLQYMEIIVSDLNLDGYPDVIVRSENQNNPSLYYLNDKLGGFEEGRYINTVAPSNGYILVNGIATGKFFETDTKQTIFYDVENNNLESRIKTYALYPFISTINQTSITIPTKENAIFLGFSLEPDGDIIEDFNIQTFTTNTTLYAVWELMTVSLTFVNYDNTVINSYEFEIGSTVTGVEIPANPSKEGHTFTGWNRTVPTTMNEDVTISPLFTINQYTITFNSDGGTAVSSLTADFNSTITKPNDPTKEGHRFLGWFVDEALTEVFVFNKMPAEDLTLFAKWAVNRYTITYTTYDAKNPEFDFILDSDETIVSLKLNSSNSGFFTSKNRVFMWGSNSSGQVGDGTTVNKFQPVEITHAFNLQDGENIIFLGISSGNSLVLTSLGRVFTWGSNFAGQLGDGTNIGKTTPRDITSFFDLDEDEIITRVEVSDYYAFALTSKNQIYSWGYNQRGQLANGTGANTQTTPLNVTQFFNLNTDETVADISLGGEHGALLTSENRLLLWGKNNQGQVGIGTISQNDILTPVEITTSFAFEPNETIASIDLSESNSFVLTTSNRLFGWGDNSNGQVGDGTKIDKSIPVDVTSAFNFNNGEVISYLSFTYRTVSLVTSQGRIFVWANTTLGLAGLSSDPNNVAPRDITNEFDFLGEDTIDMLVIGGGHYGFVTSSQKIYTWGLNHSGQLGHGNTTNSNVPREPLFRRVLSSSPSSVDFGRTLNRPNDPVKAGYVFNGWYTDDTFTTTFDFTTMPASNFTVFGQFLEIVTLTFTNFEGTTIISYNLTPNEVVTGIDYPTAPVLTGYTFREWDLAIPTQMGSENFTIQALYDANEYTITFNSNGGTAVSSLTEDFNSTITKPNDPKKEGHTFAGWYVDVELTEVFVFDTMPLDGHKFVCKMDD